MLPQENFGHGRNVPPQPWALPRQSGADGEHAGEPGVPAPGGKRAHVLALYESGMTDVAELARETRARAYFVSKVLQRAGHLAGYFDLFTPTEREQNVYARYFRRALALHSVEAAEEAVRRIDRLYDYFARLGDRAGQHHAQVVALTGQNRARASRRDDVAQIYHDWLAAH